MSTEQRHRGRPTGTKIERRRYLTDEELERFMVAARRRGRKYDLLFSLAYYFAMRVAEVVEMRMDEFHLPIHQVTIRGKKGGHERPYDLPEPIEQKYQRWLKERATLSGSDENPYVFPSSTLPRSGHISRDTVQGEFRLLAQKAGIPMPRSVHDLRHTVARQMIRAGEDLVTIQGFLRHRDLKSTEVYLKDEKTAVMERRMSQRAARFL
jgi:integrase/recombinase XerD